MQLCILPCLLLPHREIIFKDFKVLLWTVFLYYFITYIPWWNLPRLKKLGEKNNKWQKQQVITKGAVVQTFFQYITTCADNISLTLVYLRVHWGMRASLSAHSKRVVVCALVWMHWDTWYTCVKQMTPMPVWVSPRCGWCMDHVVQSARGHIGSIVLGSSLNVALNLHWVKERFTSSAQPSTHLRCRGGVW